MPFSSPQKINDYPAEYLQFAGGGKFWLMDQGAELMVFEGEKTFAPLFVPGTNGWPVMILEDGTWYRGFYTGNLNSSEVIKLDKLEHMLIDDLPITNRYAFQWMEWHDHLPLTLGALKPLASRIPGNLNASLRNYPLILFDRNTQKLDILQTAHMPVDCLKVDEDYFIVAADGLQIFQADGNLVKTITFEDNITTSFLLPCDSGRTICRINAAGLVEFYSLIDFTLQRSWQLSNNNGEQHFAISAGNRMIASFDGNKLQAFDIFSPNPIPLAIVELPGDVAALACHPVDGSILFGLNARAVGGTYIMRYSD